jgi:hypothetical protein
MSVQNEMTLSPMLIRFGVDKVDRRATRSRTVREVFSPLPDELTPVSDTPNTGSVIGELDLKFPANVVGIRVFLKEKPNDHSLLGLHSTVKNLNVQKHESFQGSLFSRGEGPDAQPWCSEVALY